MMPAHASSHREAPFITTQPKVDGTDLYMFASYEPGRDGYITLVANYQPLQDAYGGPNYFSLDQKRAVRNLHRQQWRRERRHHLSVPFQEHAGRNDAANRRGQRRHSADSVRPVTAPQSPSLNVSESYQVGIVRGDRRRGSRSAITNVADGSDTFAKPVDNIGTKTLPDYAGYAAKHIYNINIPGCSMPGRMFVGQRQDPFAVNLGVIFDLVHAPLAVITDPTLINAAPNSLADKNVTALELEVHKSCLVAPARPTP